MPLTSGRSGLASAVIYQPSCSHQYFPESINIVQHTQGRGSSENKSHDTSSGSSSMQIRYSMNRGSSSSGSNNNQDDMGEIEEENSEDTHTKMIIENYKGNNNDVRRNLVKFTSRYVNHFLYNMCPKRRKKELEISNLSAKKCFHSFSYR